MYPKQPSNFRVVDSKNKEFPKGKLVVGSMGWQTYSVVDPEATQDMGGHSVSETKKPPSLPKNNIF